MLTLLFISHQRAFAQRDSLVFYSGTSLVGEIKKMDQGVLEIDVPFGDENFRIKWLDIYEIHAESKFVIGIKNEVFTGRLASQPNGSIRVFQVDSTVVESSFEEIVYLSPFKQGFADRFSAAVEVGFNITKAQDLRQFSLRTSMGYKTDKWSSDLAYNVIRSSQDGVDPVKRSDGLLNYRRILTKNWYLIGSISSLANTEQLIDLRANTQLGVGRYILSSNRAYWGVKVGVNNNLERFTNETESRNTWEGYLGTELNLYDTGDLELALVIAAYPGLSETGRFRTDINFDTKYELPLDFFIRLGLSLNYDNQPAQDASETDYILRTGIGWEW